ncbi:MAG TPA: RsmE family RNA methyltransferase [Oligoflexia bacterium]|nr:RsmE family RNA methyltransferase [Oligoflexia bacterium]HMP26807.1 RsmE family RNA methyltransferase [Oligoflexia bacterium]
MIKFIISSDQANALISSNYCELSPEQSHHCLRVLRVQKGEKILLIDPLGKQKYLVEFYKAQSKDIALLKFLENAGQLSTPTVKIIFLPSIKQPRLELAIEKLTEIGIETINIFESERSKAKLKTEDPRKKERFKKISLAAAEQSANAPAQINLYDSLADALSQTEPQSKAFICSLSPLAIHVSKLQINKGERVSLAVGPEGDLSSSEKLLFEKNNFIEIYCGESVLRSETAAIVATSFINIISQAK